ncbi:unnamed protein product, partial [Staurois parvus]
MCARCRSAPPLQAPPPRRTALEQESASVSGRNSAPSLVSLIPMNDGALFLPLTP